MVYWASFEHHHAKQAGLGAGCRKSAVHMQPCFAHPTHHPTPTKVVVVVGDWWVASCGCQWLVMVVVVVVVGSGTKVVVVVGGGGGSGW